MRVATWNVLHRIHAVNWREPVVELHPDEPARIAEITRRIVALDAEVVCLQEVSGDQLASLQAALPAATILSHRYPRVPKLFRPGSPPLVDPSEQLVTISKLPVRTSHGRTFPTDQGKGYLLAELESGVVVITTHVSYGAHRAAQASAVRAEAFAYDGIVVVLGDFNADLETCLASFGELVAAAPTQPSRSTRPRTIPTGKSEDIDHILVRNGRADDAAVLAGDGFSDHNPVIATIH